MGWNRTHIVISTMLLFTSFFVIRFASVSALPYFCANDTSFNCDTNQDCIAMKVDIQNQRNNWQNRYPLIACAFIEFQCNVTVEIGVARGELSNFLLDAIPKLREHHGVDPFVGNYDSADNISNMLGKLNSSSLWSRAVLDILKHHGCKFRFHYGRSIDRILDFKEESVDCIFVDGDHTYDGILQDIKVCNIIFVIDSFVCDKYHSVYLRREDLDANFENRGHCRIRRLLPSISWCHQGNES